MSLRSIYNYVIILLVRKVGTQSETSYESEKWHLTFAIFERGDETRTGRFLKYGRVERGRFQLVCFSLGKIGL